MGLVLYITRVALHFPPWSRPELGLCRHSVNVQEIIRCGFCSQELSTSEDTKETIMEQI